MKSTLIQLAAIATFGFGMSFGMAAPARNLGINCWDICLLQYHTCIDRGTSTGICLNRFTNCTNSCPA